MTLLLSSEGLIQHEFPSPLWLVEPMIPQGGLAILHGKPGVGKTQFITTLSHAINTGQPLFGRWPTRKGSVVVIQADMTGQIQQDRVMKVLTEVALPDTHWVVEEDGSIPLINIQTMHLKHAELVMAIQAIDPVLIVWDTLRKIHLLPENASETPVTVFHAARAIHATATHLFLHHDRKESRDPDANTAEDEGFMGSQQWKGSVDATMALKELGASPKRLALTFHKARTALDVERAPLVLELDIKTMLLLPTRLVREGGPAARNEIWRTQ